MASPPSIPQLNMPRKRTSMSSTSSNPMTKKRKPSQLRNAFSPDAESGDSALRYSRSPSVDSVATGSIANGGGGRKRKRKDGDSQSVTGSVRGSKARSAVTGAEGEGGDADGGEEGEDEDEDEGDGEVLLEEGGKASAEAKKEAKEREKEAERMLIDAMTPAQQERYSIYRRIRLKRETVRKLVNQTLSQSVPQPIIIAVTSYSKAFIGELVDRALTVRDEWAASRTHLPNPNLPPNLLRWGFNAPKAHRPDAVPNPQEVQGAGLFLNQVKGEGYWKEIAKDAGLEERLRECDKGPLTPAHLREALRRYKRDREGGAAGFAGLSLEGVERTLGRTGGRRLFR